MSYIYDTNPIVELMRRKSRATAEAIKAAAPAPKPSPRRTLQYTILCMGTSVKSGGPFGHKDR